MNYPKLTRNPFILFSPFLALFFIITFLLPTNGTSGDENNYIEFAHNLSNGFYSPPPPGINLQNGPGYPLIIAPFLALGIPLMFIAFFNAIIFYLSVVFLFKALMKVTARKIAIAVSLFWGLYYNLYLYIPYVLPEILTVFLVSILIINTMNAFESKKLISKSLILSGIIIGYLALTKPIFGYVMITLLFCFVVLFIINRKSLNYKKSILILIISLVTTAPYLLYTFNLTGKMFYWSTIGGNNLYWMSTPYESENGSWIQYPINDAGRNNRIEGSNKIIENLHQKDFDEINKFQGVEQDDIYREKAINNIKSHPVKFLKNIFSNGTRIILNFPFSYELQRSRTFLRMPHNGIILVFSLFFLIPTVINWKKISFSIRFLLFFTIVYLGGSLFGSAEIRMFAMIVPILLIWVAYIFERSIQLKLDWTKSET